jgi:hypothetical protein
MTGQPRKNGRQATDVGTTSFMQDVDHAFKNSNLQTLITNARGTRCQEIRRHKRSLSNNCLLLKCLELILYVVKESDVISRGRRIRGRVSPNDRLVFQLHPR